MGQESMQGQSNKAIRQHHTASVLRKNLTDAERRLWKMLRGRQMHGYKFRRQHPFLDFVLDFVCVDARLVLEVDGGQHGENEQADKARTKRLELAGFRVLRFWNNEVMENIEGVYEVVLQTLKEPHPHPDPPLEGEGTK